MLLKRLDRGQRERSQFVSSQVDKGIAYQIRALRDRQDLSQEQLAELVDMNQNAISRLESTRYGRPTITTLKRLAAAFDVALVVRFVPFSQLMNWVSGTPFVDNGIRTEAFAVPSYNEEKKSLAFLPATEFHARSVTVSADMNLWTLNVSAARDSLLDLIVQESAQSYIPHTHNEADNLPFYVNNLGAAPAQMAQIQ